MDDQLFQMLMHKMNIMEAKIDDLIAFKYWIVGIGAGSGGICGFIVSKFL